MNSVRFITLEMVLAIHESMIIEYGGSEGIRDLPLLTSALARPQSSFDGSDLYPTIFDKAAALFHSLLFNHAFVDGNKRTAVTTTARFLWMNGFDLSATDKELVEFPLAMEKERMDLEEIASWLEKHASQG